MILPPSILRLRVQNEQHRFGLWLPLILIWPLIVLAALVLAPLVLVLAIVLWPAGWGRPLLLAGPRLFGLFCALRGLEVRVEQPKERVIVHFM